MKYVLDTCSYFWLVDDQTKLSAAALSAIGDANNSLHISAITVTEIHRLVRKGKVDIRVIRGGKKQKAEEQKAEIPIGWMGLVYPRSSARSP